MPISAVEGRLRLAFRLGLLPFFPLCAALGKYGGGLCLVIWFSVDGQREGVNRVREGLNRPVVLRNRGTTVVFRGTSVALTWVPKHGLTPFCFRFPNLYPRFLVNRLLVPRNHLVVPRNHLARCNTHSLTHAIVIAC